MPNKLLRISGKYVLFDKIFFSGTISGVDMTFGTRFSINTSYFFYINGKLQFQQKTFQ